MMHYKISSPKPETRYIEIDLTFETQAEIIELHLPAWRPGRYELGNFAKNIQRLSAFDTKEHELPILKTNKDTWQINCKGTSKIVISLSPLNISITIPDTGGCLPFTASFIGN